MDYSHFGERETALQAMLWTMAGLSIAVIAIANVAERRRAARADLDRVGWVPWPAVIMTASLVATLAIILAIRA